MNFIEAVEMLNKNKKVGYVNSKGKTYVLRYYVKEDHESSLCVQDIEEINKRYWNNFEFGISYLNAEDVLSKNWKIIKKGELK